MSDTLDWSLIIAASQKAQAASEAAASMTKLMEAEMGGRITAIEARMASVEGRLSALAAGQHGHSLAIERVANILADHTARLTRIDATLKGIEAAVGDIAAKLGG